MRLGSIRLVFVLALTAWASLGWARQGEGATSNPGVGGEGAPSARILLIATPLDHPWGSHMYLHECRLLAHCLNQTPGVEAIVSPEFEWPADPALLEGVRGIVYYSRQAGDIVLAESRREEFQRLMRAGVGFAAIHWATKAEAPELLTDYLEILGGAFHSGPDAALNTSRRVLEQVDPVHPVCRGWSEYELRDEWYLNLRWHQRVHPVLKVNVDGMDHVVAWTFERTGEWGPGRSFGTTLAHFHDNFEIEAFRRAIVNGILWSAGVDVPTDGAPVAVTPSVLEIGPEPAR